MREMNREELKALIREKNTSTDAFRAVDTEFRRVEKELSILRQKRDEILITQNNAVQKVMDRAADMMGHSGAMQLISSVETEMAVTETRI